MKCRKCGVDKPDEEFYRMVNYRRKVCKTCHKADVENWRDKNREKVREITRRSNKRIPAERFREYSRRSRRKHMGEMVAKVKERRALNPVPFRAQQKLRYAVRSGKIERPKSCEECGSLDQVHGHHDDYSKPLEVRWLCPKCHAKTKNKAFLCPENTQ